MIPLTFLYDEYIDRPKFTEQKKNPFEYIVPSPTSGVGTISKNDGPNATIISTIVSSSDAECAKTMFKRCIELW